MLLPLLCGEFMCRTLLPVHLMALSVPTIRSRQRRMTTLFSATVCRAPTSIFCLQQSVSVYVRFGSPRKSGLNNNCGTQLLACRSESLFGHRRMVSGYFVADRVQRDRNALHSEELLYCIIRVVTSRRVRWGWACSKYGGEEKGHTGFWWVNPRETYSLEYISVFDVGRSVYQFLQYIYIPTRYTMQQH